MWIQEAQKHADPTDPDPEHWSEVYCTVVDSVWDPDPIQIHDRLFQSNL